MIGGPRASRRAPWSSPPRLERPDLLAEPVAAALAALPDEVAASCAVAEIDPDLADTAAFCEAYGSPLEASANCVVVAGSRSGEQRFAACVVLATTRADVNGVVRKRLDVRKASFAPMDTAVELTGMAYGGITPFGLPAAWPLLVDAGRAGRPRRRRRQRNPGQQARRAGFRARGGWPVRRSPRGWPLGTSLVHVAFGWLNLQRRAPSARRASCPPSPSPT